jgi:hypothetical protein
MTRAELLTRISSRELTEWVAFEQVEPFGKDTQYYGPAINTAMLANINRKKGTKPLKPDEFVPKFEKQIQPASDMKNFARNITLAMGGQDLTEPKDDDEEEE